MLSSLLSLLPPTPAYLTPRPPLTPPLCCLCVACAVSRNDSFWPVRFLAVAATFGCAMFIPEPAVFGVYAEVARVLSIVWMLFQVQNIRAYVSI